MKKELLFCFILMTSISALAQGNETVCLSPDQLKLRADLENDKTILQIIYGESGKIGVKSLNAENAEKENSRIRLLIYQASRTADKTVKGKKKAFSKEGTPMVGYLIVENGKTAYIADYSRDKFGGFKFIKFDCIKLFIGTYAINDKKSEMIFTPLEDKDLNGKTLALQCQTKNQSFIF